MSFRQWLDSKHYRGIVGELEAAYAAGYQQGIKEVKADCAPLHERDSLKIAQQRDALDRAHAALDDLFREHKDDKDLFTGLRRVEKIITDALAEPKAI